MPMMVIFSCLKHRKDMLFPKHPMYFPDTHTSPQHENTNLPFIPQLIIHEVFLKHHIHPVQELLMCLPIAHFTFIYLLKRSFASV